MATVCAPESSKTVTVGAASAKLGAWFTPATVIVKVLVELSTPPLAVPPESCAMTVTVAEPLVAEARVKVSVPLLARAGWMLKRPLLLFATV